MKELKCKFETLVNNLVHARYGWEHELLRGCENE